TRRISAHEPKSFSFPRIWSGKGVSNSRPQPWQGCALPTELFPRKVHRHYSRLMQNPLGAAFARKVLRCKARDEGRMLVLFDEARNAAAGHFSCKPFGAPWVLHQPAGVMHPTG